MGPGGNVQRALNYARSMSPLNLFKCESCNDTFSQKHDIKKHILSLHVEKKPYNCVCNEKFFDKISMKQHFVEVHDKAGFSFKICSRFSE